MKMADSEACREMTEGDLRDWEVFQHSSDYPELAGALGMDGWLQGSILPVPRGSHPPSSPVQLLLIPRPLCFITLLLYHTILL